MKSLKQILDDQTDGGKKEFNKYVSREYQDYGYRLAAELGDISHKALYIKLAKNEERRLLEIARRFAIDSSATRKGALFMWKLGKLKDEKRGGSGKNDRE